MVCGARVSSFTDFSLSFLSGEGRPSNKNCDDGFAYPRSAVEDVLPIKSMYEAHQNQCINNLAQNSKSALDRRSEVVCRLGCSAHLPGRVDVQSHVNGCKERWCASILAGSIVDESVMASLRAYSAADAQVPCLSKQGCH